MKDANMESKTRMTFCVIPINNSEAVILFLVGRMVVVHLSIHMALSSSFQFPIVPLLTFPQCLPRSDYPSQAILPVHSGVSRPDHGSYRVSRMDYLAFRISSNSKHNFCGIFCWPSVWRTIWKGFIKWTNDSKVQIWYQRSWGLNCT